MDHFDPYNVLLAIATNIPVLDCFCAPGSHIFEQNEQFIHQRGIKLIKSDSKEISNVTKDLYFK